VGFGFSALASGLTAEIGIGWLFHARTGSSVLSPHLTIGGYFLCKLYTTVKFLYPKLSECVFVY
jgi:hypothetical protein